MVKPSPVAGTKVLEKLREPLVASLAIAAEYIDRNNDFTDVDSH